MKKIIIISFVFLTTLILATGCSIKKEKEVYNEFKEEYEKLNDDEHRNIKINTNNPYIKITLAELVEKIENKETFYVYFGDSMCPWCRSVIEKSIEVANKNEISEIYYIDTWDEDGNEIFRDKSKIVDGKLETINQGSDDYFKILEYFKDFVDNYTLEDEEGNHFLLAKGRIFLPSFFYIKKGEVRKKVTGLSEKQKKSDSKLTEDILKDEEETFDTFFNN